MRLCENQVTDYYSANFTEDETEWSAGATYLNGDEARYGHYIYKYAGVDGTNSTDNPTLDTTLWVYDRVTNYYAAIGGTTTEQTGVENTFDVQFEISGFDTLAILNMDAEEVIITFLDNAGSVISGPTTYDLTSRDVIDYTSFFFAPFKFQKRLFIRIPFYLNSRVRIQANKTGTVKVGRIVLGRSLNLGVTLFGANFELTSQSREVTNEFGTTSQEQVASYYSAAYNIRTPSQNIEYLKDLRKDLAFKNVLFVGDEEDESKFQNLLSYGEWESNSLPLDRASFSTMKLTIKESI